MKKNHPSNTDKTENDDKFTIPEDTDILSFS